MLTRRNFLASTSALAAISAIAPLAHASNPARDVFTNASLGDYAQGLMTEAHFTKLLGSLFMVFLPTGDVAYLRLHKVVSLSTRPKKGSKVIASGRTVQSFSASFHSTDPTFPQGSYLVDHGTLGRVAMFLVQGQTTVGSTTYEATFTSL